MDETGWRQGTRRAWLWGAVTAWGTVVLVRLSRGGQVARALLDTQCQGILVTDRCSASTWYPVRWRQGCWAHLLRDIAALSGRGGYAQESGAALRRQAHQLVHWWHRVREGTRNRSSVRTEMTPVRRQGERPLHAGTTDGHPKTAGLCREGRTVHPALWTCVPLKEGTPTPNASERVSVAPATDPLSGDTRFCNLIAAFSNRRFSYHFTQPLTVSDSFCTNVVCPPV